ncbi:MAG: sulfite exporter TauE/SafE family protein [Legionellaceae bacterium]|nr:sulfite exporter TauE/SafE family protein [Legionellaceae bacterium]
MMMILAGIILFLSIFCVVGMICAMRKQAPVQVSTREYIQLTISGIIAFMADTFGVGSFAVNVALAKMFGTFSDEELPAVVNGAQVVPGIIEAIFFMQFVDVDVKTLLVLVLGTCIGGVCGGKVVSYTEKQHIRLVMLMCFSVLVMLLIGYQMNWFPIAGEATSLDGWRLGVGFLGMMLCGALTSVGVGLFVMIQSVLFLLGVSPEVAFPIMTIAGAMQQPLTTLVFLKEQKIPLKKTMILSVAGCLGVFFALPIFNELSEHALRTLLLAILVYNVVSIGRAYVKEQRNTDRLDDRLLELS